MGSPVRRELRCARAHTTTKELPCFAVQRPSRFLQTTLLQRDWYAKILQRYCPRRRTSSWSQIKVGKFEALAAAGCAFGTLGHSERYAVILGLLKARTPERRELVLAQAIAKLGAERQTATSPDRSRQSPQ